MRQKIVAGNWKMNNDLGESKSLVKKIAKSIKKKSLKNTRVIVAPTFVSLQKVANKAKGTKVEVAAQNMHFAKNGAFTGEISADMLKSVDVNIVILGHSERREYFGETVYKTTIPRNVRISEAPSHGKPAILYDVNSSGSMAYIGLAREILEKQGLTNE